MNAQLQMITSVLFDDDQDTELKADFERPQRFLLWQLTANALLRVLSNRERMMNLCEMGEREDVGDGGGERGWERQRGRGLRHGGCGRFG